MAARHKIAIFASGYGSNFEAIARACRDGEIDAEVVLLVCDKPSARVCSVAERMGIPSLVFSPADYASKADYEREIAERCGYSDQHYFSYCFKKYCGVSPNAMRQEKE